MICIVVVLAFLAGGVVGALLFEAAGYRALYVPATISGLAGFGYAAYRQRRLARGDLGEETNP